MNKKVLLKDLVDTGSHIRKQLTPKAIVTDNGQSPAGEFWDANTIMLAIAKYVQTGGFITISDIPANSVGSQQIIDGEVNLEDLSDEVRDKLQDITIDEGEENVNFG